MWILSSVFFQAWHPLVFYGLVWYSIFMTKSSCVRRLIQMFEMCPPFKYVSLFVVHSIIWNAPVDTPYLFDHRRYSVVIVLLGRGWNQFHTPDSYEAFMVQKNPKCVKYLFEGGCTTVRSCLAIPLSMAPMHSTYHYQALAVFRHRYFLFRHFISHMVMDIIYCIWSAANAIYQLRVVN